MTSYNRWYHTVRDQQGNAINGASVTVYNAGTPTQSNIWNPASDDSNPQSMSNPYVTDATGRFGFMAQDGEYDLVIQGGAMAQQNFRITLSTATAGVGGVPATDLADTSSTALGDALVGVKSTLTGGVARTQDGKNADAVSTFDFMTPAQIADIKAGTASLDVTTALQAAIDAVSPGLLYLPPGIYKTTTPLTLRSGLHLVGAGYGAANQGPIGSSIIQNAVSDLFANDATGLTGMVFEGFTAKSLPGGSHIFNLNGAGAVTNSEWKNLVLIQNNATKSVLTSTSAGGFFANWLHNFSYYYAASSTTPALNLANPFLSHVSIQDFYSYGSNTAAGTYSIGMEGTGGTPGYACRVVNGVFEQPGGGGINLLSITTSEISNCMSWDMSVVPANPFINVNKSATTAGGSSVLIKGCRSVAGNASFPDLKFDGPTCTVSVDTSYLGYVDGTTTTSANFLTIRNSAVLNIANFRWTAEGSYLPSASVPLGTYLYASGINNTIISKQDTSGNLTILGGFSGGSLTQTGANSSLSLKGNRSAADAGPDVALNSTATRTAGNLAVFQNNGANQAAVNWSGGIQAGALNAGGIAASSAIYSGTGVPSNTYGVNGDFCLRSDTPGTANQRLYVKAAGSWTGIL